MCWANRGFVCFVNLLPAQPGRCLGNASCPCSEGYLKPSFPTSNLCLLAADLCYLLVPGWSCYLQPCKHFKCCTCIKLSLFSHWHDWLVALPCGEWTLSSHQEVAAAFLGYLIFSSMSTEWAWRISGSLLLEAILTYNLVCWNQQHQKEECLQRQ